MAPKRPSTASHAALGIPTRCSMTTQRQLGKFQQSDMVPVCIYCYSRVADLCRLIGILGPDYKILVPVSYKNFSEKKNDLIVQIIFETFLLLGAEGKIFFLEIFLLDKIFLKNYVR